MKTINFSNLKQREQKILKLYIEMNQFESNLIEFDINKWSTINSSSDLDYSIKEMAIRLSEKYNGIIIIDIDS